MHGGVGNVKVKMVCIMVYGRGDCGVLVLFWTASGWLK